MPKHSRQAVRERKRTRYSPEERRLLRRKRWAIVATALLSVAAIVMVAFGVLLCEFNYNYVSLDGLTDQELGITGTLSEDVINIALFGVDTRRNTSFKGNSDTIMILSIDQIHNKIKLTSVMRDSLVKIDGYRTYKINSAYAHGGPQLGIHTLNSNFNLDIREYVTVNFNGMANIIDGMGGVDLSVTESEMKDANIHIKYQAKRLGIQPEYITQTGPQHLNGLQAVAWARIRHVRTADGVVADFGRTDRQRYVLELLFDKAVKMDAGKYPSMIKSMLPYVETSLSYSDLINLASVLHKTGLHFEQTRVPDFKYLINAGYSVHGASCVYYNLDYAAKVTHAFIYDDVTPEEYMEQHGVDKSSWYSD